MASRSNPYGVRGGTPFSLELMPGEPPARATAPTAPPAQPSGGVALSLAVADIASPIVAPPERKASPPAAAPMPAPPAVETDPHLEQAAREYAQGLVDQALWDRALLQAQGDKAAAAGTYLRARSVALRALNKRVAPGATTFPDEDTTEERRRFVRRIVWKRYAYAALGAAAMAMAATTFVLYLGSDAGNRSVATPLSAAAPATGAAETTPRPRPTARPAIAPTKSNDPASHAAALLQAKIEELRAAGDWNAVAQHAVQWTRLEPANPSAWDQLRAASIYLGQYENAVAAARKAVEVAPQQAMLWRSLGEANVARDDAAAAIAAFRQAVARNPDDVPSLQAIGLLATRLGDTTEASAAFDRALTVRPGNTYTACLRSGAALLPSTRDASIAVRHVADLEAKCRGAVVPSAP